MFLPRCQQARCGANGEISAEDDTFFAVATAFNLTIPGFAATHDAKYLFPGLVAWDEQIRIAALERDPGTRVQKVNMSEGFEVLFVTIPGFSSMVVACKDEIVEVNEFHVGTVEGGGIGDITTNKIGEVPIATELMADRVLDMIRARELVRRGPHGLGSC
jgi:hypothetical protein